MALVRERRQLNLRLPIPETSHSHHPSFPLQLPPTTTTTTTPISNYKKLSVLGHGNGGTVYKVEHKTTGSIYALKIINLNSDPTIRRHTLREIEILRHTTDSPQIIHCHHFFNLPTGDIAILMEYMDNGTLNTLLQTKGKLTESLLAHIANQVLTGLTYLHSRKIVHRDVKPANLLLNKKMEVKIADFGVSRIMTRTLDPCNSYVGTCAYMSPERFDPDTYGVNYDGYAGDIWSLGLTLLELYLGHFPLLLPGQRPDWATLMCAICFGESPSLPEDCSMEFRSFVQCCLQKEAGKRSSAEQLLKHPFVVNGSR